MTQTVFYLDFDETLMNTDRLRDDLTQSIAKLGGSTLAQAYQSAYEAVRKEHGGVSIPLVLKALPNSSRRKLAKLFHDFPYQTYVYPGAESAIAHLKERGSVIIFSDGDAFFQPQKIYTTSLAGLVDGVVILPKKVNTFNELAGYYPADRYVFIDDKIAVLSAAKGFFGDAATTVHVKQGRYADQAESFTADYNIKSIAGLVDLDI